LASSGAGHCCQAAESRHKHYDPVRKQKLVYMNTCNGEPLLP